MDSKIWEFEKDDKEFLEQYSNGKILDAEVRSDDDDDELINAQSASQCHAKYPLLFEDPRIPDEELPFLHSHQFDPSIVSHRSAYLKAKDRINANDVHLKRLSKVLAIDSNEPCMLCNRTVCVRCSLLCL